MECGFLHNKSSESENKIDLRDTNCRCGIIHFILSLQIDSFYIPWAGMYIPRHGMYVPAHGMYVPRRGI